MKNNFKRLFVFTLAILFMFPAVVALSTAKVQAAPYSTDSLKERAEAWTLAREVSECIKKKDLKSVIG